jgi:catalase
MTSERDDDIRTGPGGETHQIATADRPALTTNQGVPISDDQSSLKAGRCGPTLLEDFILREKITHFDHERIPERVVHARGFGVRGRFRPNRSWSDLTCADFLSDPAQETPVFVRFSTVVGSRGSMDTARDVRGFAVKFYTREGVYDLVGNNIPVFFIQDAMKFPDLIHSVKPEQDRGFPQAQSAHDTFWDFASLNPEITHMLMWVMSDRAIPRSFRMMEGFGVNTFRMVDAKGDWKFVKFHWKPRLGTYSLLWDEAVKLGGADPDYHRRDLWSAIERGEAVEFDLGVQIFDPPLADRFGFDVLDATKLIPEELVPVTILGTMVLDENVSEFFAETEQVAFCPAHLVPGIDFSEDPLLQGRLFSYLDTQLSRLGSPNFHQIPVNRPRCPVHNFQRGGHMQLETKSGRVAHEPSKLEVIGPRETPDEGFASVPASTEGFKVRWRPESFAEHYGQARMFWISQTAVEQTHIVNAFVFELSKVETAAVRARMLGHLALVDEVLGARVAEGLGMAGQAVTIEPAVPPPGNVEESPALSLYARATPSIAGRVIGVLVTDGVDAGLLREIEDAARAGGAHVELVAPTIEGVQASDGQRVSVRHTVEGGPSVLFDAVVLAPTVGRATWLAGNPAAVEWVRNAFVHLKAIGYNDAAHALLQAAGLENEAADLGLVALEISGVEAFIQAASGHRIWSRELGV